MDDLETILPELRLYARSLVRSDFAADDLVSDTCVRVLERQSQFKPDRSFIAWAITILKNIHRDDRKSARSKVKLVEVSETVPDPTAGNLAEDRLELNETHRAIHELPVEQREVLILYGAGFRYDEIAERLDIPKGTVMSRLHNGRRALEELTGRKEEVAV